MKRVLYYIFVLIFSWGGITGDTDCSELFKLPELLAHYQAEKNNDLTPSFFSFMLNHYFDKHASSDEDNHSKLPFHNHSDMQHSVFDYVPKLELVPLLEVSHYHPSFTYVTLSEQNAVNSFFVPPKCIDVI